jgi:hypothetical protein
MRVESQCALQSIQNGHSKADIGYYSIKDMKTGETSEAENNELLEASVTSTSAIRHSSADEPTSEPLTITNIGHGDVAPFFAPSSILTPSYGETKHAEVPAVRNSSIVVNAPGSEHFSVSRTVRVDSPTDFESVIPSTLCGDIPEDELSTIRIIDHVDEEGVAASNNLSVSHDEATGSAPLTTRSASGVDAPDSGVSYGNTTSREISENPSASESEDAKTERNSDWPDAEQFQAMRKAFTEASLSYIPAARMILCRAPIPGGIKPSGVSDAIHLPLTLNGWEMFGVVQRAEAVSFNLTVPFHDRVATPNSKQRGLLALMCDIVYHPANDSCTLFNTGRETIYIGNIEARQWKRVEPDKYQVLHPGYWRVSVGVGRNERTVECLVDLLLLQRRYRVSLSDIQLNPQPNGKRTIPASCPRGRRQNPKLLRDEFKAVSPRSSSNHLESLDTEHITDGIAVLDLEDGQTARIQSIAGEASYSTSDAEAALESCSLTRIDSIASNNATIVFTCKHTGIGADQVVAKVLCYGINGDDARRLWSATSSWVREMTFLKKLKHVSVSFIIFLQ